MNNSKFYLLPAAAFVMCMAQARPAHAIAYWACLQTGAVFNDNENIENLPAGISVHDEYDDDTANPLNGAETRIRYSPNPCNTTDWTAANIQILWNQSLNYDGCTSQLNVTTTGGCFEARVWSSGKPKYSFSASDNPNNQLHATDKNGYSLHVAQMTQPFVSSSYAHTIVFNSFSSAALRVYATVAHAMRYFSGQMQNTTLNAYIFADGDPDNVCPCGSNSGSHACGTTNLCYVQDLFTDDTNNMFLIGHEYGHANLAIGGGGHPDNDCTYAGGGFPTGEYHQMNSPEYQACGLMEGWANFVAADMFTVHANGSPPLGSNPNAAIGYWGNACGGNLFTWEGGDVVNLENGTGTWCPINALATNHPGPYAGYSTEVDWMRTLWAYHTNYFTGTIGYAPNHTQLRKEFAAAAFSFTDRNAWDELRKGVAKGGVVGGTPTTTSCTQLQRLSGYANQNGAHNCYAGCDLTGC